MQSHIIGVISNMGFSTAFSNWVRMKMRIQQREMVVFLHCPFSNLSSIYSKPSEDEEWGWVTKGDGGVGGELRCRWGVIWPLLQEGYKKMGEALLNISNCYEKIREAPWIFPKYKMQQISLTVDWSLTIVTRRLQEDGRGPLEYFQNVKSNTFVWLLIEIWPLLKR